WSTRRSDSRICSSSFAGSVPSSCPICSEKVGSRSTSWRPASVRLIHTTRRSRWSRSRRTWPALSSRSMTPVIVDASMWHSRPRSRAVSRPPAPCSMCSASACGMVTPRSSTSGRVARLAWAPMSYRSCPTSAASPAFLDIVRVAMIRVTSFRRKTFRTRNIAMRTSWRKSTGRSLRGLARRWLDALGGHGDLLGHLGDVTVRVPDLALAVGAVTVLQDPVDPGQLVGAAEVARDRPQLADTAAGERARGHLHPLPGGEVHQRRVQPVAEGEPLVLRQEHAVVGEHLALLVAVE